MKSERITVLVAVALSCVMLGGCAEERTSRNEGKSSIPAQSIDWGDDSSEWANDNECDDPRFEGPGIHSVMLEEDRLADATDCRKLYEAGQIWLKESAARDGGHELRDSSSIDWGDDASQWSNDGECDDPRFAGPGAASIMLDEDLMHDATDCRKLYEAGQVRLK